MKTSTEQDYRRRIARVIEAIIVDPAALHSIESLAALAHFSPFHFHRLYRALTGESVAATVRRVRLAQAAHRLSGGAASVTETALDAGYDSSQSFARAFRDLTGLSPSGFQAQQQALSVTIIERPPIVALCLRHDGPAATIPHSYRRLRQWAAGHGLDWGDVARIGIGYGDPEQAEGFRYLAGLILPDQRAGGDGLERCELPGGRYGSYRLIGSYALIAPTFQTLFGGWLPQSGLEPDDRPVLELYHENPAAAAARVTDLLIPICEAIR
jgi:AraC family transcriptional regulator